MDNRNISNAELGRGGLYLNSQGKLAINFIEKIKSFKTSWQVAGSFHNKFFDCDFSQKPSTLLHLILMIYMKSGLKIQID